jgi:hypothetical protein
VQATRYGRILRRDDVDAREGQTCMVVLRFYLNLLVVDATRASFEEVDDRVDYQLSTVYPEHDQVLRLNNA